MSNQKVNWIIENIAKEPSYLELAKAARNLGYPLLEINGDYSVAGLNQFAWKDDSKCFVFNGSIEMAKLIRKDLAAEFQPLIYCSFEKYKCSNYYSHFGQYLFNDRYALCSLSELNRNKLFYYGVFGKEALIFIRPDSGEKTFQAQLLDLLDFDSFFRQNKHLEHELVLVSTPKNIKWEGRIVVSKHKDIIAHSTYRFQGQVTKIQSVPPEALKLANELLKIDYYPDSVFCYDLCMDSDDAFWLLELTSFSSAGLYSCDKKKIVERVSEMALENYNSSLRGKIVDYLKT